MREEEEEEEWVHDDKGSSYSCLSSGHSLW